MELTVEVVGLELFGHHGVGHQERRDGQIFVFDVWVDVPETALSDRVEDTVDYRDVVAAVCEASRARQFQLLEALATSVADTILERLPVSRARVRVRKPEVRLAVPVDHTAATVERRR